ncbi:MAG: hypothetical protein JW839_22490, partial [Candidatus Lokiarchaeota archaeon]|nr:hypothetical protein [Candidatus Lokiarchaeota archaeon]
TARILALVIQPWIALALLALAAIWLVQALEPDGDIAELFAPIYNLDVSDEVDRAHYIYILGGLPIVEFLSFAIGNLAILPFSFYTSAVILQDTRAVAIKGREFSDDYEQRHRQYAAKGLFNGGIFAMIIGAALFGIGFVLGIGLDATWPLFQLDNYRIFMDVYAWFPIAFGVVCMAASIAYYARPAAHVPRVLAWYCALVLMLVPVVGWFFGLNLIMNLRETGKNLEPKAARKQVFYGLFIAAFSVLVPLFVFWMIGLNKLVPSRFDFAIDLGNLSDQVDGIAWTATLVLAIALSLAAVYSFMEARASTIDAQRKFQVGMGMLFTFLAITELVVMFYSIYKVTPYPNVVIFPEVAGQRGDIGWVLPLAGASVVYITYCIEKYIKNSQALVFTKLQVIFCLFGPVSIVVSYIPAVTGSDWYGDWGGYLLFGAPAVSLLIGLIAIPIVYGALARQTSGTIKKNALTILFGFLITVLGIILHAMRGEFPVPFDYVIYIIMTIVGVLVLMRGILSTSY